VNNTRWYLYGVRIGGLPPSGGVTYACPMAFQTPTTKAASNRFPFDSRSSSSPGKLDVSSRMTVGSGAIIDFSTLGMVAGGRKSKSASVLVVLECDASGGTAFR